MLGRQAGASSHKTQATRRRTLSCPRVPGVYVSSSPSSLVGSPNHKAAPHSHWAAHPRPSYRPPHRRHTQYAAILSTTSDMAWLSTCMCVCPGHTSLSLTYPLPPPIPPALALPRCLGAWPPLPAPSGSDAAVRVARRGGSSAECLCTGLCPFSPLALLGSVCGLVSPLPGVCVVFMHILVKSSALEVNLIQDLFKTNLRFHEIVCAPSGH